MKQQNTRRTRLGVVALAVFVSMLFVSVASAQKLVDQILALVNDDPITRTDLLWSIALDPKAPSPAGPVSSDLLKQKLEVMMDQRLVAQEAARVPSAELTQDEVDKKRAELIRNFKSEAEFRDRAESVGLTPDRIDDLIRERILIDRFVDFRFRSFVFVTEPEIKKYYEETLVAKVRAAGQVPPPIEKVSDNISALLKQEKINTEIDRWLSTVRQRADVVQLAEP
ncbi:MAG TPA: hypothetical protein VNS63_24340 [Blastocatellia bacterium]|nr:hypothetical protein [Blastocatellia bacterium]